MHRKLITYSLIILLAIGLVGCATGKNPNDPYEKYNRAVFKFNETADTYVLKPTAEFYSAAMPKPLNSRISHFMQNLGEIPTIGNDLLQANFYQALSDTWRFIINSTIGVLGFFDVASDMGLEPNHEDFGLTLAKWGYTNSSYFVIPFLGPSTVRDTLATPINYQVFSIYPRIKNRKLRYGIYALDIINTRASLLQAQNLMQQAALDKYVFIRNAYMQRRKYLIDRNNELDNPYDQNLFKNPDNV